MEEMQAMRNSLGQLAERLRISEAVGEENRVNLNQAGLELRALRSTLEEEINLLKQPQSILTISLRQTKLPPKISRLS